MCVYLCVDVQRTVLYTDVCARTCVNYVGVFRIVLYADVCAHTCVNYVCVFRGKAHANKGRGV